MENEQNSKNENQEEESTKTPEQEKVLVSGLRDESLQAFKDYVMEIMKHLGIKDDGTIPEEEWEKKWREFWGKIEKTEPQDES